MKFKIKISSNNYKTSKSAQHSNSKFNNDTTQLKRNISSIFYISNLVNSNQMKGIFNTKSKSRWKVSSDLTIDVNGKILQIFKMP